MPRHSEPLTLRQVRAAVRACVPRDVRPHSPPPPLSQTLLRFVAFSLALCTLPLLALLHGVSGVWLTRTLTQESA